MIRRDWAWAGALLCACGVVACGGSDEVVRAPQTTKVVWGDGTAAEENADELMTIPAEA